MNKLRRVYRRYEEWEELRHNMWGSVENRERELLAATRFTGDAELYGYYMQRVIREWPVSCENALTDYSLNRKAWLGHAACALAGRWPEDLVREAWRHLSDEQQLLANRKAAAAIQDWENAYVEGRQLHPLVGVPVLPEWFARRSAGPLGGEFQGTELQGVSVGNPAQRSLL